MIFLSVLILIVGIASTTKYKPSTVTLLRVSVAVLLISAYLTLNSIYILEIGSGLGVLMGFFEVTAVSQSIDLLLFLIGSIILTSWPLNKEPNKEYVVTNNNSYNNNLEKERKIEQGNLLLLPKNAYASEYSLIILFTTLGATLLVSSSDLLSMYLSIELQSFGVYLLTTLYRDSESATSAGLKYFLLGGLSSCFILLGAGLIYAYTGLTQFESIYSLSSVSESYNLIQGITLGVSIVFIGFLFKIAAAPLHNWSPDVYDGTPTIVTIWLTIMPKISIITFLLEIQTHIGTGGISSMSLSSTGYSEVQNFILSLPLIGSPLLSLSSSLSSLVGVSVSVSEPEIWLGLEQVGSSTGSSSLTSTLILNNLQEVVSWGRSSVITNLLLLSSLLSLILGTVVGLAQVKIKRLLAYSTISHVGFMLLALAINTEQSIDSLIFYIIQYTLTNLNIFLIILALGYYVYVSKDESEEKDIKYISDLKGAFESYPLLSLSLTICLFSMAGTPPLIGFFSKQFVLYSALQKGYYFMSIVAIIVSVVSAFYYLKIIKVLHTPYVPAFGPVSPRALGSSFSPFMYSLKNVDEVSVGNKNLNRKEIIQENSTLTNFHSFLISGLTLTILLFVLKPYIIVNSTQLLSLTLFNV